MWIKSFLLVFISLLRLLVGRPNLRIVGGEVVTNTSLFPYLVSVRRYNRHICGGSILSTRHVLTAAHCCVITKEKKHKVKSFVLRPMRHLSISSVDYQVVKHVQKMFIYKGYTVALQRNDIAILLIDSPFQYNHQLLPIQRGDFGPLYFEDCLYDCGICTVVGWGNQKFKVAANRSVLRSVELPIVPTWVCQTYYGPYLTEEKICAGRPGKDACQGDSGGPLVCDGVLIGIVSSGSGCAQFPGMYTSVAKFKYWIDNVIEKPIASSSFSTKSMVFLNYLLPFIVFLEHIFG